MNTLTKAQQARKTKIEKVLRFVGHHRSLKSYSDDSLRLKFSDRAWASEAYYLLLRRVPRIDMRQSDQYLFVAF